MTAGNSDLAPYPPKERILIVSEATPPQINGVLRTNQATRDELQKLGHEVLEIGPDTTRSLTFSCPEPHVYLEFFAQDRLKRLIDEFAPTCRHISTEGPLGRAARGIFLKEDVPFTTSYHTRWPEFARDRAPFLFKKSAFGLSYASLRHFHAPAQAVMVATPSMMRELHARGFQNLKLWERGVDTELFKPLAPGEKPIPAYEKLRGPILVYFGRVADEKNLEAFLTLKQKNKVVIGTGNALDRLRKKFPDALWLGVKEGQDLVRHCAAADLCVFPSKNDTFGLTLVEAAAMGLRIAAYPAPGPLDILGNDVGKKFSVLDENLQKAVDHALNLPNNPQIPREFVLSSRYSWTACTQQFLNNLRASNIHD